MNSQPHWTACRRFWHRPSDDVDFITNHCERFASCSHRTLTRRSRLQEIYPKQSNDPPLLVEDGLTRVGQRLLGISRKRYLCLSIEIIHGEPPIDGKTEEHNESIVIIYLPHTVTYKYSWLLVDNWMRTDSTNQAGEEFSFMCSRITYSMSFNWSSTWTRKMSRERFWKAIRLVNDWPSWKA